MDPGLANAEGSGLADDVASADWVLLTGSVGRLARAQHLRRVRLRRAQPGLRDHFCEVGSYEDGLVVLYRRCR